MGEPVRYLLIVARGQPDLHNYLTRAFSRDEKVQVLLDRRQGERRRRVQTREQERRRGDRRSPQAGGRDVCSLGVGIVRLGEGVRSSGSATKSSPTARILVIDDEPGVRDLLREVLAGEGYTAVVCADAESGVARFREEHFDVVLTDLNMPACSGWDVARSVKLRSPTTPVILTTMWADYIDAEKARALGIDFVIRKPFRRDQITGAVAQALSGIESGKSRRKEEDSSREPVSQPSQSRSSRGTVPPAGPSGCSEGPACPPVPEGRRSSRSKFAQAPPQI